MKEKQKTYIVGKLMMSVLLLTIFVSPDAFSHSYEGIWECITPNHSYIYIYENTFQFICLQNKQNSYEGTLLISNDTICFYYSSKKANKHTTIKIINDSVLSKDEMIYKKKDCHYSPFYITHISKYGENYIIETIRNDTVYTILSNYDYQKGKCPIKIKKGGYYFLNTYHSINCLIGKINYYGLFLEIKEGEFNLILESDDLNGPYLIPFMNSYENNRKSVYNKAHRKASPR